MGGDGAGWVVFSAISVKKTQPNLYWRRFAGRQERAFSFSVPNLFAFVVKSTAGSRIISAFPFRPTYALSDTDPDADKILFPCPQRFQSFFYSRE
jgi:hypothetical protein